MIISNNTINVTLTDPNNWLSYESKHSIYPVTNVYVPRHLCLLVWLLSWDTVTHEMPVYVFI